MKKFGRVISGNIGPGKKPPYIQKLKAEAARELGLMDELIQKGWGGLSSRDTGRIGGFISQKKRQRKKEQTQLD